MCSAKENMTMTLQCRLAGLAWLGLPCPHRLRWSIPIVDAASVGRGGMKIAAVGSKHH